MEDGIFSEQNDGKHLFSILEKGICLLSDVSVRDISEVRRITTQHRITIKTYHIA